MDVAAITKKRQTNKQHHKKFDVYLLTKPVKGVDNSKRKLGLLKLVSGNREVANRILAQGKTRIARSVTQKAASQWIKRLSAYGWHAALVSNGKLCFATDNKKKKPIDLSNAGNCAKQVTIDCLPQKGRITLKRLYSSLGNGSFCLPVNWVSMPHLNTKACIAVGDTDYDLYWIAISQTKQSVGALVPLKHYAEAVCKAATSWVKDGKIVSVSAPGNKRNTYRAIMTGKVGDKSVAYYISVHETKKMFYCAYGWTELKEFPKYKMLFQVISNSFKKDAR